MDIQPSRRIQNVKPSPTLAIAARAQELRAEQKEIVNLGAGEPDFDTPDHIKQAAIEAIKSGFTKYTAVDGTQDIKQAVIDKFTRDNQLNYTPSQILISCGGKQSIYNLAQALLDPGDEVIIPAPYWVSYPDIVLLANGCPVIIPTGIEQGFKITPAQLEAAITPRTRLFIINSPSNPTGVVYTRDELSVLGEILMRHPQIVIATDDIYEHILWADEPFSNIINACPDLYPRTVVINGVSKAYSMTGWRIGYAGGPAKLISAMKKVQSQSTSNPVSIAQAAATVALNGSQDCIQTMLAAFKERHDFVFKQLNMIDGIQCLASQGTFYSFPNVRAAIARLSGIEDDVQFSEYLLTQAEVAVVPGSAFGCPGYVRISFATSMDNLNTALNRIRSVVQLESG